MDSFAEVVEITLYLHNGQSEIKRLQPGLRGDFPRVRSDLIGAYAQSCNLMQACLSLSGRLGRARHAFGLWHLLLPPSILRTSVFLSKHNINEWSACYCARDCKILQLLLTACPLLQPGSAADISTMPYTVSHAPSHRFHMY